MSSRPPKIAPETLLDRCKKILAEEAQLREGGGKAGQERQHKLGRMLARERIAALLDQGSDFFEVGLWAAYKLYQQWGNIAAAGTVAGIGNVHGIPCLIVANDATVKAGAFFPQTCKKLIRAQRIAFENSLPLIYLVDSTGVFLPMQDEIFPDEDDFGRIFRNNSVISAAGLPQFAAIMGNCVAGGAYLPVLCDKILMTQGRYAPPATQLDRKSTRLNSSHLGISYAVFCLKKKSKCRRHSVRRGRVALHGRPATARLPACRRHSRVHRPLRRAAQGHGRAGTGAGEGAGTAAWAAPARRRPG